MSLLQRACKTLGGLGIVVALPAFVFGQSTNSTNYYAPSGVEYTPAGSLPGDQVNPSLAFTTSKGYMVWQDNITDGDGLGISAIQLNSGFSPFRVNTISIADQENPQVAMLPGGAAVFVWQSGPQSFQHIYARFLSSSGTWGANEIMVNATTNQFQANPQVAVLTNGNVAVVWSSYGQDNADGLQGIYGQILSSNGQKVGGEFAVNQFTPYNQRTPAVSSFKNGNFIVAWVSEKQRLVQNLVIATNNLGVTTLSSSTNLGSRDSVDVYARIFNSSGTAVTSGADVLINVAASACANPSIATAPDGSYIIAWSQKDSVTPNNSWDIWAQTFTSNNVGGTPHTVNTQLYGDQFAPKISAIGNDYMVVWTSLGQDGSFEGIYSQFLRGDGSHAGVEKRVNTSVVGPQKFPAIASDGISRFIVGWSGINAANLSFDLFAQNFGVSQPPVSGPAAPYVKALDQYSLAVSWPPAVGVDLNYYKLIADGIPISLTNNMWSDANYDPSTTHTFQLAYVLNDGTTTPLSLAASGTTWGRDNNHDGLPDDWQAMYWGANKANWPAPTAQLARGVTVLDVFLWGANPNDPSTWLRQSLAQTPQGLFLNWNTVPGAIYQVMVTTDLKTWTPLGSPRFEAGTTDSLYLGKTDKAYYQIVRNLY